MIRIRSLSADGSDDRSSTKAAAIAAASFGSEGEGRRFVLMRSEGALRFATLRTASTAGIEG